MFFVYERLPDALFASPFVVVDAVVVTVFVFDQKKRFQHLQWPPLKKTTNALGPHFFQQIATWETRWKEGAPQRGGPQV